jgi:WD40 repeat protein
MVIDVPKEWTQDGLTKFLSSRSSEDKYFECKTSIHFSWDLKNSTDPKGNKPFADNPFHSSRPINNYLALRAIESIMAFANADGGLLLLGVAESRVAQGKSDCEGFKIINQSGDVKFIIHGIEEDQIGYQISGILDHDKYIREVTDILFPKIKNSFDEDGKLTRYFIYKKRISDNKVRHFKRLFSENYSQALILKEIKLIPFSLEGGEIRTAAALVIKASEEPIFIYEKGDHTTPKQGIYVRLASNRNVFLENEEMAVYLKNRVKERNDPTPLTESSKPLIPPIAHVSPYFRKELENYVIPNIDDQPLPDKIYELISEGKNVLVLGEGGLGKSLLMAHCFLNFDLKELTCFYAIDRTQGPDVYKSAAVINSLRTQIEGIAGLSKINQLAHSGSKKDWVYERECLEKILRERAKAQPDKKLVVFLDGIDENFLATRETDFILNILKNLIIDNSLGVIWVFSSQPHPRMKWIESYFELLTIRGLGDNEAKALLLKWLPSGFDTSYPTFCNELIKRSALDSELYDPEMIVMLGKGVAEKLGSDSGKIRFISEDILKSFLGTLPLNTREKYHWLFERYTDESKIKDIPSLEENAKNWNSFCQSIPYTRFFQDIFSILSIIRRPIPFEILAWALELKDKNPTKDFKGSERHAFISYPESLIEKDRDFLRTALLDLQSLVKVIDQKEGSYAFCKEAIRESFSGLLSEKNKNSAKFRLAALATEEVKLIQDNTLNDRPLYITRELLYFLSLNSDVYSNSVEQLLLFEFFPEWLERRALCEIESESQWTSDFMDDLKLLDSLRLSEKAQANLDTVIGVIKDWKYFLDDFPRTTASFLRNETRLSQIWKPAPLSPNLLIPLNGYSRKIHGHSAKITSLAMLPDGHIASLGHDNTIRIWDITTGNSTIIGEFPSFYKIKALPDGHLVCYDASSIEADSMRVWDVNSGKHETLESYLHRSLPGQSTESFIKQTFVDVNLRVHEYQIEGTPIVTEFSSSTLMLLPDGRIAQTAGKDIQIADIANTTGILLKPGHKKKINCLSILPNGNLVSGGEDGKIKVWDLTHKTRIELDGYNGNLILPVSNDSIVTNYGDNLIQVWDLTTRNYRVLGQKTKRFSNITILKDGRIACIEDYDKIRIWDVESEETVILEGHSGQIRELITLPDGRLVSGSSDKTIRIWDLSLDQSVSLPGYGKHNYSLTAVSSNYLVSIEGNKIIRVWDIDSQKSFSLRGNLEKEEIFSFLVRIDNERIAVFSDDPYTIRIWNIKTKRYTVHKDYPDGSEYTCGTLLTDGRIALGCYGGAVQLWDMEEGKFDVLGEAHSDDLDEVMFLSFKELSNNYLATELDNQPSNLIWNLKTGDYFACQGAISSDSAVETLPNNCAAWCRLDKVILILNLSNMKTIAVGFLEGKPEQLKYHQQKKYLIVRTTVGLEIFNLAKLGSNETSKKPLMKL